MPVLVLERMVVRLGFRCGNGGVVPVVVTLLELGASRSTDPVPAGNSQGIEEESE
jgi:hypothetical protein